MNPEIARLASDGVIAARRHPALIRAINACHDRGELGRVLPGIYCLPGREQDRAIRLQAVRAYGDDLVITGLSAAALTWWRDVDVPDAISIAGPRDLVINDGFSYEQRHIRPDLTMRKSGVLVTAPELTVLDLILTVGDSVVDEALRRRATTLPQLERALKLTPGRRGNKTRREILDASRDAPWSPLERQAHRQLREAGIRHFQTNYPVRANGRDYFIDIALPEVKLGLEIDGEEFHNTTEAFHYDRVKDQDLASIGWQNVRFTKRSLPRLVPMALRALAFRDWQSKAAG